MTESYKAENTSKPSSTPTASRSVPRRLTPYEHICKVWADAPA